MHVPNNISHYNESTMDLYVWVSKERLDDSTLNASKLNFTWHILDFRSDGMDI